uniref:Protein phosphatase 1, regulatory subunit 3Ab n=1 Tax=Amphiprion percula TaxID=161767 RepID=A0A3P8S9X7_AMPPE
MESVGLPSLSGASSLLGVPGFCSLDVDEDEGDVVIGIRPKSSPLPRRRSSATDDDSEPEPPPSGSRRVSFADAKGLSLVQVKEFGTWDVPKLPGYESSEGEGTDVEEFFLSPLTFSLPWSTQELFAKVREQKVELEAIELIPGTTILKGIIRVLNISFSKAVYVRTTLDTWSSHFDLLAEYVPGSSDGLMDCFSFKLTLVPPFGEQGARVDFCLRYETPLGTFWSNNDNRNYVLFCHQKIKTVREKPQKEKVNKKSCLKTVSYESTSNTATVSSENLVSQTNSFTFGTVVAPLYHQVFGRVGSESQSTGDGGNPIQATLNTADLNAHTKIRQISCIDSTDATSKDDNVQVNLINNQESSHECLNATLICPPTEEQETSFNVSANEVLDCAETTQDPTGIENTDHSTNASENSTPLLGDTLGHPERVNMLNKDLLNPQIHTERLHLQVEEQEDKLTPDLQSQITGETPQSQLPEPTCKQIETNLAETLAESETQEVKISLQSSFILLQPSQSDHVVKETEQQTSRRGEEECVELNSDHNIGQTETMSKTNTSPKADKLLEALHDVNSNHIDNSVKKESEDIVVPCRELEKRDFTTPETSLETQDKTNNMEKANKGTYRLHKGETEQPTDIKVIGVVAESMTKATINEYDRHGDMLVGLKDEESLEDIQHCETEAAVPKQDVASCLTVITEAKNWEMMVEEEENSILTNQEEYEPINLKTGTEVIKRDTTEEKKEEFMEEIIAAGVQKYKADNAVRLEDKEWIRKEEIAETVTGLVHVQVTEMEKKLEEEERADEERTEGPKETEVQKEKYFAEMHEINIKSANVKEEKELEEKEKIQTYLIDEVEAGVELEDEIKPKEENREENPEFKEDDVVDLAVEIEDAESCMVTEDKQDEVLWSEERLVVAQNEAEVDLSALVNNKQEGVNEKETDKENTEEGQNLHFNTEIRLCKEDDFQSNTTITHDRSKAEEECFTAEAAESILADEPEIDQTSHDSASSESDSDDEVELYMHCLRAVHTGAQAHKDRSKDVGFTVSKRPSVSRGKLLSMPSISESLDEEQHLSHLQENHDDGETASITALSASSGQESVNRNVSRWKDTFSCSNISKTLLYTTLLVVFLVVAYRYDFLACFGLYLISVVWLCCQGDRQTVKNDKIG